MSDIFSTESDFTKGFCSTEEDVVYVWVFNKLVQKFFFDKLDIFTAEGKEKWAWKLKNTWLHPGNCVKAI